ncbi:MAG: N-methyl-L-tryptophan oxidase [Trueperaceae bacterium]
MRTFDSIVIGTGVMGAAAAMHLARRGSVLVLEQFDFLHERGSSHGGSRIYRHAYEDAGHVRLAVAADAAWTELEERSGERLLLRTGGIDIGTAAGGELDAVEAALRAEGRPCERLGADEAGARFPAFAFPAGSEVLFQADAGILAATRALATMLAEAAADGAVLREREAVLDVRPAQDGVEVVSDRGRYAAGRVVVAAGPWLARLAVGLDLPLRVEHQQVLYVRVRDDARAFARGRMPVFIDRRENGAGSIYGFPMFERPGAVKVSDHSGAPTIELNERRFDVDEARAAATVAAARTLLPGLGAEVVDAVTCLYTKTPDERFVLDCHPDHERVVFAGGGSGHAFKFGPLLGEILADLAMNGHSRHDLAPFAVTRFGWESSPGGNRFRGE